MYGSRLLALADHVERLVEEHITKDYARLLGRTRARMSQVINPLGLSPRIQEQILTGDPQVSDRSLRAVAGEPGWERQEAKLLEGSSRAGCR